jgi:hypothetical protein
MTHSIHNIKNNVVEVCIDGLLLLLSYNTPVAWYDMTVPVIYRTNKKWSSTTSRHISDFIRRCPEAVLIMDTDQTDCDLLYKNILAGKIQDLHLKKIPEKDRFDDLII